MSHEPQEIPRADESKEEKRIGDLVLKPTDPGLFLGEKTPNARRGSKEERQRQIADQRREAEIRNAIVALVRENAEKAGENPGGAYFEALADVLRYQRSLVAHMLKFYLRDNEQEAGKFARQLHDIALDALPESDTPHFLSMSFRTSIFDTMMHRGTEAKPMHAGHHMRARRNKDAA